MSLDHHLRLCMSHIRDTAIQILILNKSLVLHIQMLHSLEVN